MHQSPVILSGAKDHVENLQYSQCQTNTSVGAPFGVFVLRKAHQY